VQQLLPCNLADFPCQYLGLPLSLKKLTKDQLQPLVDKIADQLPGWKADLLTRPGKKVLVQIVLTAKYFKSSDLLVELARRLAD
jgi:hypothetical protein